MSFPPRILGRSSFKPAYSSFQLIKKRFTTKTTKGQKTQKKEILLCLL
jgi:hypothetical protein